MKLRIGLSGATGRMGREIAALVATDSRERFEIITSLNRDSVFCDTPLDCWIDFSAPDFTLSLLSKVQSSVVIGTTGFDAGQIAEIHRYAERFPVFLASNMSVGVEVMRQALQHFCAPQLPEAEVFIEEEHHRSKKDSPSGTAIFLQEALEKGGYRNVAIRSTRAGGIVGVHTVRWITDGEEITISHRAFNRSIFARGALEAAVLLASKPPGLYKMSNLWEAR